jgi:hypothetical protein
MRILNQLENHVLDQVFDELLGGWQRSNHTGGMCSHVAPIELLFQNFVQAAGNDSGRLAHLENLMLLEFCEVIPL